MKVLVVTTPGSGHIHPVVPVAAMLQDAGHEVVWATAGPAADRVRGFGFEAVAAGLDRAERGKRFAALGVPLAEAPPRDRRRLMAPGLFVEVAAPAMAEDLGPLLDEFEPDLVVNEPCEVASAPLAAGRGIPHVTVGFGDFMPASILDAMAPGIDPLWAAEGLPAPAAAGYFDHLYVHPFPEGLGRDSSHDTVRRVRPAAFDAAVDAPPAWVAALGRDRPLVYVTFGTEFAGLAPFESLMDALDGLDVDAVLTTGGLAHGDLPTAPANVRLEQYVPQRFLLDRSAAVVSQAGSGVLIGAALAGLPQVSIPMAADQFENADALAATGAGVTVEGDADGAAIRAAVQGALGDDQHRRAAHRLAGSFSALPEATTLLDELVALTRA